MITHPVDAPECRPGSALLLVVGALVLLEMLCIGALTIASGSAMVAGLGARHLQARLAAESAIREILGTWTSERFDTITPGTTVRRGSAWIEDAGAEIEAVRAGRFLVRGFTTATGADRVLARALVATLPYDSLRSLFDAALHTDGPVRVLPTASIDGFGDAATGPCTATPAPGLTGASAMLIDPVATILGSPPYVHLPATHVHDGIAGIHFDALRPLADIEIGAIVSPRPGVCSVDDPLNWGDPAGSGTGCSDRLPFVFSSGDLTIAGGSGQGTLLVMGRLHISGDARFDGAILARSLDLVDGSIHGAVRTFTSDTSSIAGSIRYDPCALRRALGAPALRRPFRHGARLWLPAR